MSKTHSKKTEIKRLRDRGIAEAEPTPDVLSDLKTPRIRRAVSWVQNARHLGYLAIDKTLPPYIRVGYRIFYRLRHLEEFLAARTESGKGGREVA